MATKLLHLHPMGSKICRLFQIMLPNELVIDKQISTFFRCKPGSTDDTGFDSGVLMEG